MVVERTNNLPESLELRRKLRRKATPEENAIWKMLRAKKVANSHWYRQFSVGPYVLDFYCPEVRLCVEVDGIHHNMDEEIARDERRTRFLNREGIEVLRIPNEVVWNCSDMVIATIEQAVVERRGAK